MTSPGAYPLSAVGKNVLEEQLGSKFRLFGLKPEFKAKLDTDGDVDIGSNAV